MSDGLGPGVDEAIAELAALRQQLLGAFVERRHRRPAGLPTRLQEYLLCMVHDRGVMPVSDVAPLLDVAPATASQLLTAVEERGWLERAIVAGDRRRHRVALTAAGLALVERMEVRRRERLAAVLAEFSGEERAQLIALARRVAGVLARQADVLEGI